MSQGTHNVAGAVDPSFYKHEKYFDAHLTSLGWAQAQALRQHVATHGLAARLEVVVVSPLTRAVETAVAAFGGDSPVPSGAPCLMAARPEVEGLCTAHPGAAAGPLPFVACELCREHLGVHPCDRRRPLSHYQAAFPAVDWSHITQEQVCFQLLLPTSCSVFHVSEPVSLSQDELWTPETRESDDDLANRAGLFLRWLLARPEQRIAVVTHSSWLSIMFKRFTPPDTPDSVTRWFENAELRTMTLVGDADGVTLTSHAAVGGAAAAPAALDFIPSVTAGLPMHVTISTRSIEEQEELVRQAAPAGHK